MTSAQSKKFILDKIKRSRFGRIHLAAVAASEWVKKHPQASTLTTTWESMPGVPPGDVFYLDHFSE